MAKVQQRDAHPMTVHTCQLCGGRFERPTWATTGTRNYCDGCFSVSADDEVTAALRTKQ